MNELCDLANLVSFFYIDGKPVISIYAMAFLSGWYPRFICPEVPRVDHLDLAEEIMSGSTRLSMSKS